LKKESRLTASLRASVLMQNFAAVAAVALAVAVLAMLVLSIA
jgi:hypothetical protein